MAYYNNDDSGCSCGCIILFLIMAGIGWCVEKCSDDSQQNNDTTTNSVINTTKTDETFQVETESLSEEDAPYSDNHLMTGDTPYKLYYGDNYCCKYPQCSGIEVTAPISSDIVVIIKRNNQNGKVNQGHLYQIFAYISNSEFDGEISGMLLYASTGK